jgi:hypothetical protein
MGRGLVIFVATAVLCTYCATAAGATFTLSTDGLMALDYRYTSETAAVVSRTEAGSGIKFSIWYPGNEHPDGGLYFTSCNAGGDKKLAGIDISAYDAFGLEFTLLSVNGQSTPQTAGPLIVGALINRQTIQYAYQPQVIGFDSSHTPTAGSVTTTDAGVIDLVGFVASIPSWWWTPKTNPWPASGSLVELLVEPVPGAVQVPEPGSMSLLGLGALLSGFLGRQRSLRR